MNSAERAELRRLMDGRTVAYSDLIERLAQRGFVKRAGIVASEDPSVGAYRLYQISNYGRSRILKLGAARAVETSKP